MGATAVCAVEEVPAPTTEDERHGQSALAEILARGEAIVTVRRGDGAEVVLDAEDVRGLRAVVAARALGHRVSIVAHDLFISPQTAAEFLGVSRPMVYRYIARGDLDAVRVGSHWRMRAGDVVALASRRAQQSEAIDIGFAAAVEVGAQMGRHVDAKQAWRDASPTERDETRALVADILEPDARPR